MEIKRGHVYHIKDEYFDVVKDSMFPTIEKYVDHVHIINGEEAKVINQVAKEIEASFNKLMRLIELGKKVIFTDVDNDLKIMLEELKKDECS